jgi:hypothetical protein
MKNSMLAGKVDIAGIIGGQLPEIKEDVRGNDLEDDSRSSQVRSRASQQASTPVWSIGAVKTKNKKLRDLEN